MNILCIFDVAKKQISLPVKIQLMKLNASAQLPGFVFIGLFKSDLSLTVVFLFHLNECIIYFIYLSYHCFIVLLLNFSLILNLDYFFFRSCFPSLNFCSLFPSLNFFHTFFLNLVHFSFTAFLIFKILSVRTNSKDKL